MLSSRPRLFSLRRFIRCELGSQVGSKFTAELVDVLGESGIEGIDISGFISSHLDPAPFSENQAHEANAGPYASGGQCPAKVERFALQPKQQKQKTKKMLGLHICRRSYQSLESNFS